MIGNIEEKLKDKETVKEKTGKEIIAEFGLIVVDHGEKPGTTSACGIFCSPIKAGPTTP